MKLRGSRPGDRRWQNVAETTEAGAVGAAVDQEGGGGGSSTAPDVEETGATPPSPVAPVAPVAAAAPLAEPSMAGAAAAGALGGNGSSGGADEVEGPSSSGGIDEAGGASPRFPSVGGPVQGGVAKRKRKSRRQRLRERKQREEREAALQQGSADELARYKTPDPAHVVAAVAASDVGVVNAPGRTDAPGASGDGPLAGRLGAPSSASGCAVAPLSVVDRLGTPASAPRAARLETPISAPLAARLGTPASAPLAARLGQPVPPPPPSQPGTRTSAPPGTPPDSGLLCSLTPLSAPLPAGQRPEWDAGLSAASRDAIRLLQLPSRSIKFVREDDVGRDPMAVLLSTRRRKPRYYAAVAGARDGDQLGGFEEEDLDLAEREMGLDAGSEDANEEHRAQSAGTRDRTEKEQEQEEEEETRVCTRTSSGEEGNDGGAGGVVDGESGRGHGDGERADGEQDGNGEGADGEPSGGKRQRLSAFGLPSLAAPPRGPSPPPPASTPPSSTALPPSGATAAPPVPTSPPASNSDPAERWPWSSGREGAGASGRATGLASAALPSPSAPPPGWLSLLRPPPGKARLDLVPHGGCSRCGNANHSTSECPDKRCSKCGMPFHDASECPLRAEAADAAAPRPGPRGLFLGIVCPLCGETDCPGAAAPFSLEFAALCAGPRDEDVRRVRSVTTDKRGDAAPHPVRFRVPMASCYRCGKRGHYGEECMGRGLTAKSDDPMVRYSPPRQRYGWDRDYIFRGDFW